MEHILRHGRVFFIYDTERCQREEDDPEEAVCFLQPRPGGDTEQLPADALHMVCQLMGSALFTERNMGSFPSTMRLQYGEFVLLRDTRFIWAMHTSGEDATFVTRKRLLWTRRALRLLLGGPLAMCSRLAEDAVALRARLSGCLRPLLATGAGPSPLHTLLDVPPWLDWAEKDEFMGQQLADLQQATAAVPGVLTCVLCWNGQIISSGCPEDLMHILIHIYYLPEEELTPAADVVPPDGALVAAVYLEPDVYSSLKETAQPHWRRSNPAPEIYLRPSLTSAPPPLSSIEERAESRTTTASSGTSTGHSQTNGSLANAVDRSEPDPASRRRRRRRKRTPTAEQAAVVAADDTNLPGAAAYDNAAPEEADSEDALRSRISALALRALAAECSRSTPEAPPSLDQIPVKRLRRAPRRRANSARRRSLSDLDVPEPFSNLAYLKRRDPELYREELRKVQTGLCDNAPAFSAVAANAYSFGIPRSNRLYTPRGSSAGSPSPPVGGALSWRRWRSTGGAGYASEAAVAAVVAPLPDGRRRFHSEGEDVGWRPRQLSELIKDAGGGGLRPVPQPAPEPLPAILYVKTCGKLKCSVFLETQEGGLQNQVDELERVSFGRLDELEVMLDSYRSIPSFHGQHYSYCSWRAADEGRPALLQTEGAPQLDLPLLQMLHPDMQQGRLTDCRVRTPSDVVLAQRNGATETFYQQPTSGLQRGLPVVNGPLSRLDERAQQRLASNHRLQPAC